MTKMPTSPYLPPKKTTQPTQPTQPAKAPQPATKIDINPQMADAWEFAEHTSVSIFLTGKAGTGKTTFLRHLREHSAKTLLVLAPTGVAAINAGGQTIHSFFQLPLSPYVPGSPLQEEGRYGMSKKKLKMMRALDMLVIDEISMVRSDLLDEVDAALRKYRRSARPFGGVQLLLIGDLQQLAPVTTPADEAVLRGHYDTPYFFSAKALQQIQYVTISLTKVYRQQNPRFVDLLNHVRENRMTPADFDALASRLDPDFVPDEGSDFIRLTTHNQMADNYNDSKLSALRSRAYTFKAQVNGTFPPGSYPTAETLILKKGAQVMFLKNDPAGRFYNGRVGHVVEISATMVKVLCPGEPLPYEVEPSVWENARYTVNEKTNEIETTVEGTFAQLPLRLAWAVTIHKSQGLTFDHVVIDAGAAFASGQVYVALSRCTSLEGIVLATPVRDASLGVDAVVAGFISGQDAATAQSLQRLDQLRQQFTRSTLLEMFNFADVANAQEAVRRHIAQIFGKMFPSQLHAHQKAAETMRVRVISVADKWIRLLNDTPFDQLRTPELRQRVVNGCAYFQKELREIIEPLLAPTRQVRSQNKRATLRLEELAEDLRQAFITRVGVLGLVAKNGFTVSSYLTFKKKAILAANSDKRSAASASSVEEPSPAYRRAKRSLKRTSVDEADKADKADKADE